MDTMESTPKANVRADRLILLQGKRDVPADGVQDYCEYLGKALEKRGVSVEIVRVDGVREGWLPTLRKVSKAGYNWRGCWVVLQYTAMAWSKRGFPLGAAAVLAMAKYHGARCGVVFHEPFSLGGSRVIDRIRGACQQWVIQKLHDMCETSVFPEPLETIRWLRRGDERAVFIPIGANVPDAVRASAQVHRNNSASKTVAIYCLSDPPNLHREITEISAAVRIATGDGTKLRVVFLGRGTSEARDEIWRAFDGIPVEASNFGIQNPEDVRGFLEGSDVMLCVRGPLYSRRGSALAGIACGLPIVGYSGAADGTPIAEAGVVLVPFGDVEALGFGLRQVLSDRGPAGMLREKSLQAYWRYFSWESIAEKFDRALACKKGTGEQRAMA